VNENTLKILSTVYSEYESDGISTTYHLPDVYTQQDLTVYINELQILSGYSVYPENKKIVFDNPPIANSTVKINYTNFDPTLLNNRKITGNTSQAYAIIEKSGIRRSTETTFMELFINEKTLSGTFTNGEYILTDIIVDSTLIPIVLESFANIQTITITNPGVGYNIGDPVLVQGDARIPASAIIDKVTNGKIESLSIIKSGSGFKVGQNVYANGYTTNDFKAHVGAVNDSGLSSSNTIQYNIDIISNTASIQIDASNYFLGSNTTNSQNTIISALNMRILDHLGGITSTVTDYSYISSNVSPSIIVDPYILYSNVSVKDIGAIGEVYVANTGSNYQVGDILQFSNTTDFTGHGANAYVSSVSNTGGIQYIRINSGGIGYQTDSLPNVTVISTNGVGGNVIITGLMGSNELLNPLSSNIPYGMVESIKILDSGIGYHHVPTIDLTGSGDGSATAVATIRNSYNKLDGKWTTSDGLLSTEGIVLQGRDYYIDYSYVIKVAEEFSKFKSILQKTLHPAGMVMYSQYLMEGEIAEEISLTIQSEITLA
jgi:hypothetical protein